MVRYGALAAMMLALPGAAWAQADMMAQARTMSANQLGILEYCQSKGFVGADAVQAQRDTMAQMPPGSPAVEAEDLGKSGRMLTGSTEMSLQDLAAAHHIEVPAMCKQMGDAVVQVQTALKQNGQAAGGIPGMPAMSGMPTVPGMPAMPTMPTVQGMPTMPGAAPAK